MINFNNNQVSVETFRVAARKLMEMKLKEYEEGYIVLNVDNQHDSYMLEQAIANIQDDTIFNQQVKELVDSSTGKINEVVLDSPLNIALYFIDVSELNFY